MSTYKSFAVVGAGVIGLPIIEALLNREVSVLVLTRSSIKTQLPEGVMTTTVDYNDAQSITKVFKIHGVEVVISTLNAEGVASQNKIAEAAKEAGVKLFAPSEFGVPTQGGKGGFLEIKDNSASKPLPWLYVV
jgi:saccharopine dehydrogenase-like NADP-dependent oxidoreductase